MIQKRWKISEFKETFTRGILSDELNISPVLAQILISREIDTFKKAKLFFRPESTDLHDPFEMDGMEAAVKRIIKSLTNNEKILIYGDYDVDGTNAASMLYLFLREIGGDATIYIPNRLKEGYGISPAGIEDAVKLGASLLISVDCGITAIEETEFAKSLNIDLIICDHHEPLSIIPDAVAVLDPLKPNCKYPYKYLSGCGVTFKLIEGISMSIGMRELPGKYLDFVAVSGAADIVPLTGENRILVKFGLERLNNDPRPGFKAIIEKAGLTIGNINSTNIVFGIAPRINAVGRLGDAQRAIDLLIAKDFDSAAEFAEILELENRERRKIDEETFNQAAAIVESKIDFAKDKAIVLHKEDWHAGVIGIVASRLVEKYYRPSIMLTTVEGVVKGSARSIADFNIYDAIKKCEDSLLQFGGHKAAAGVSISTDKLDEFKEKFLNVTRDEITNEMLTPALKIDAVIELNELTPKFLRILEQFAPFGPQNMKPVFLSEQVEVLPNLRIVGNNHLLFRVKQNGSSVFDVIGFDMGHFSEELDMINNKIDIVYSIDTVSKNGNSFPQFKLKDLRLSEENN
ncbi:MAG: single-stranded-DNA-specific exonuclease RecJ [Ignavibacteria bacterium]|nr:single-stranded-DNA-specific exonuclease RecJ [Ignavibacteria bacterium]